MDTYMSIAILIIAVLCKRNYELSRKLKQENHSIYNLRKLQEKNDELLNANQNLAEVIRKQREFNFKAVDD